MISGDKNCIAWKIPITRTPITVDKIVTFLPSMLNHSLRACTAPNVKMIRLIPPMAKGNTGCVE